MDPTQLFKHALCAPQLRLLIDARFPHDAITAERWFTATYLAYCAQTKTEPGELPPAHRLSFYKMALQHIKDELTPPEGHLPTMPHRNSLSLRNRF